VNPIDRLHHRIDAKRVQRANAIRDGHLQIAAQHYREIRRLTTRLQGEYRAAIERGVALVERRTA